METGPQLPIQIYRLLFKLPLLPLLPLTQVIKLPPVLPEMLAPSSVEFVQASDKTMYMSPRGCVQGEVIRKLRFMMESKINIATWNLCLGIANKKDTVTALIVFS